MIRILLALPLLLSLAPAHATAEANARPPVPDHRVEAVAADHGERAARTTTGLEFLQDLVRRIPADGSGAAPPDAGVAAHRFARATLAPSISVPADQRPDTRLSCGARLPYFATAPPAAS